ncbi:hypothetical protein [Flagellimonas aequoris]|uniref:Uncharacterized protein n=1 Tax=Flagellimonas aequoris TaxID=2306997 RepID=A0A418N704_9FLAO|nr:hypothetical protein [Allomuricauda aequoris]RIV70615.1 hypothetical protein D2U88_09615 [Allomuricauda aequoris]TXK02050.1 hypothetical protein FQ019_09540 [Allomuricauda aequoris]
MSSKEEYNHIGWRIIKTKNDKYALEYERDVLGEEGALISISEEVFHAAKEPNCDLTDLFRKYNLDNCKVLIRIGKPVNLANPKARKNTHNKFYGRGYIVEKTDKGFFLNYQLDRHGGGMREFEINERIYLFARNSNLSTSDILKKFDLYKYDIPENDIK